MDSWKYRWGSCHYDEEDENALIDAVVLGENQRPLPLANEKRQFPKEVPMVIPFDPNLPGSLEELLMSRWFNRKPLPYKVTYSEGSIHKGGVPGDGEGGGSGEEVKRGHHDEIIMGNVPRRIKASREGVT